MASTYLQLVNDALSKINEPELTSGTFATSRGIQTTVKNAIKDGIYFILNAEKEWPFAYNAGTQTLTVGTNEYALPTGRSAVDWESFFLRPIEKLTNGNFTSDITSWTDVSGSGGTAAYNTGKARLTGNGTNAGAIEQSISTVVNREYALVFRHFNNSVTVKIGTTSSGSGIVNTEYDVTAEGEGQFQRVTFTATTTTTYIGFHNTSATYVDVDQVSSKESISARPLKHLSFDQYRYYSGGRFKEIVQNNDPNSYGPPEYAYETQDGNFGLFPIPDRSYQVTYDYWAPLTALSAYSDTTAIPVQYEMYVVAYARYIALSLRSDPAFADRAKKEIETGIALMRRDLLHRQDNMKSRDRYFYFN